MPRSLLAVLMSVLVGDLTAGQPKDDQPPPLRYTVRTEQGERSGQDHDAVLKTVKMTTNQVQAWAEEPKAAKETRSATLYQEGMRR